MTEGENMMKMREEISSLKKENSKLEKDNEHLRLVVSSAKTDTDDKEIADMLMVCLEEFVKGQGYSLLHKEGEREAICNNMAQMISLKTSRLKVRKDEITNALWNVVNAQGGYEEFKNARKILMKDD